MSTADVVWMDATSSEERPCAAPDCAADRPIIPGEVAQLRYSIGSEPEWWHFDCAEPERVK